MRNFPCITWEKFGCEVIMCGRTRFRLLYEGKYVARFSSTVSAVRYAMREFAPVQP